MPNKSFYIIDGHAHIYRAYFAPFRDLTSATGEPTKATYVFTQMLINLVEQRKPDYLAMVIDSGDESVFRKEFFPEYKANRQSPPDDFKPQEQRILQIVRDAGIPIFVKPGFEADDLIATMTERLRDKGFDSYLVSKDKDLRQLLGACVRMYDPQTDDVFDEAAMVAKLGYSPRQAVEVQTLMGDAIDNVPGIPGVGEKTAAKLVAKYGTADAVLDHLDELTPKMRENFEKYGEKLKLSRKLVTLHRAVPFEFDVETCRFDGFDKERLGQHLKELSFTSLLARLGVASAPAPRAAPSPVKVSRKPTEAGGLFDQTPDADAPPFNPGDDDDRPVQTSDGLDYRCVTTPGLLAELVAGLTQATVFSFDTETTSVRATESDLVGLCFSYEEQKGYYVPLKAPPGATILPPADVLVALRPFLEDTAKAKVGHNIKYDMLALRQAGVTLRGVACDTMVAAFLLDAGRMQFGIDRLALDLLNFRKIPTSDLLGKGKSQLRMDQIELERITRYAAEDADVTLRLYHLLAPRLIEAPALQRLNDDIEKPLIEVLVEMEHNGIAVDPKVLKEQSDVLGTRIDGLRTDIFKSAGSEFNIDSPKQLGEILFTRLQLKPFKKTKTGNSTDIEVLEKLSVEHPVPKLVLEYRSLVKLKGTYLDSLLDYQSERDQRVHTSFNQTGAATGRLSSSDPNLQNIPIRTDEGRRIRLAFVPGDAVKNVLLTADYSQIELRVLAHLSEEPALIKAFDEDQDIHTAVASEVFGVALADVTREMRGNAKTINFGIVYGVTAFGLQRRIEGLTYQAAAELISSYKKRFPRIDQFLEQCVMQAQEKGYVETMMGRRRPVPEVDSRIQSMRAAAERIAINSVVQGSAADMIKIAMVNIHRRLASEQRPSKMLLQVHDELVFETPADAAEADAELVRQEMTSAMRLRVPLKVEIGWGKNWQEVK